MKYKMIVDNDTTIDWQDPYTIDTYYTHKLYEERYFLGFIKNWSKVYSSTDREQKSIEEVVSEYNTQKEKEKYIPTYPKIEYYEDLR